MRENRAGRRAREVARARGGRRRPLPRMSLRRRVRSLPATR